MAYSLTWGGKLWTVSVPEEVGEAKWTYAQTFAATGGDHSKAMMRVLAIEYPGLGYGAVNLQPVSFLTASHAAAPYASVSGKSALFSQSRKDSQRPPHRGAVPAAKDGASGISDLCKPAPRPATSNASRPLFRQSTVQSCPEPAQNATRNAKRNTGGWMGSATTSA